MTGLICKGSAQDHPGGAIRAPSSARITVENPAGDGPVHKWVALKHLDSEDAPAPFLGMS